MDDKLSGEKSWTMIRISSVWIIFMPLFMWYYNFQYPNFIVLNKKNERFSTIELSFVRGNEYIAHRMFTIFFLE